MIIKKAQIEPFLLGRVDLSGLNFVLFEHLSVQGVSSEV